MRKFAIIAGIVFSTLVFTGGHASANAQNDNKKDGKKIVTIKRGQTLDKIAKKNDTTYPRLFNANKKIKDPDLIYAGDKIRVPGSNEKLAKRVIKSEVPRQKQAAVTKHKSAKNASVKNYRSKAKTSSSASNRTATRVSGGVWDRLAACESGGNWSINTGNGYSGGLQFKQSTWNSVGGSGSPHNASKAEQIKRGKILQQRSGWGQWPACTAKLGLR